MLLEQLLLFSFGLVTESYSAAAGTEIKMLVNLIKVAGETEEDSTEVKKSLESDLHL